MPTCSRWHYLPVSNHLKYLKVSRNTNPLLTQVKSWAHHASVESLKKKERWWCCSCVSVTDTQLVLMHVLFQFISFCSSIQRSGSPEDLPDETFNRRATLLKSLSMVMCCSPVCEKQALFALIQSYKENSIEENLIKKVQNKGRG